MILKFTIDRFEEDKAVLVDENGQSIIWPGDKLPSNLHEGSALIFEINEEAEREKKDRQQAKDIINEIINPA